VRRSVLEPLLFTALALAYIWLVEPTGNEWLRIPSIALLAAVPIVSMGLHGDRRTDIGLRLDNLGVAAREALFVALAFAAVIMGLGFALGVAQGWLTALLLHSWPAALLHGLRIGPAYWAWTP